MNYNNKEHAVFPHKGCKDILAWQYISPATWINIHTQNLRLELDGYNNAELVLSMGRTYCQPFFSSYLAVFLQHLEVAKYGQVSEKTDIELTTVYLVPTYTRPDKAV